MSAVLRLDSVSRRFDTESEVIVAVDAVTFSVERGEVVALVGPSGSGKTTTLNLVLGWELPDDGEVRVDVDENGWAGLAVVPQELGLLPELSARENVELAGRLVGLPASGVDALLEKLDLSTLDDRLPEEMSMGEQQRVAVARAASLSPRLVVADEPTAHQDERRADLVMEVLADIAAVGGAVLVATHDVRLLDRVDRVIEMLDGRVVEPHRPLV